MLRDGGTYGAVPSSVLAAMRMFGYEHEKDIVWRDVSLEAKSHAKGAQATWRRMLQAVAPVDGKSFKGECSRVGGCLRRATPLSSSH